MSTGFRARPPNSAAVLETSLETALDKRAERPDPTPSAAPPVSRRSPPTYLDISRPQSSPAVTH